MNVDLALLLVAYFLCIIMLSMIKVLCPRDNHHTWSDHKTHATEQAHTNYNKEGDISSTVLGPLVA